ncbi:caspase family protein [Variovorax terrae]|uniref:Caspase family protein n=1 Tax=Variovorax terrae TaxID=2923278 RepID=A0A9X1VTQ6_9BURK|nr:caspase family protein [Variovorax terrae]MCJ0761849.1 caspase family protein [Variovorax terrae]
MTSLLPRACTLLAAALLWCAPPAMAARLALVIGNDTYRNVPALRNARTDASAMARALEQNGFKVTLLQDLDERSWRAGLRTFKARVAEGDDVVFFYAGHGVQIDATNYLLPVDIRAVSEDQVRDEAVPLQRVLEDLEERKARFSMVIVDACRDNPFRAKGRALGGRGLVPTTAATGQMIIYSAGSGQQALDQLDANDKDPNGLFTRVFLKELGKPGLPVDRMLRSVRDEVARTARSVKHDQVPALYDQSLGDFYFRQGAPAAPTGAAAAVPVPPASRQPVIGFARFEGDAASGALVTRIAGSNLERSGRFALADAGTASMSENQRPDAALWQSTGASYVVGGSAATLPDGRVNVKFRAWNLANPSDMGGQSFTVEARDLRLVAHRISDFLQLKITGIPGTFSSRSAKATQAKGRYTLMVSDSDGANSQPALASPQPVMLPTWSPGGTHLAYVSLESGPPVFFIHTVSTGVRRTSAATAQLAQACTAEISAFQGGPEASREDWLKDDWMKLAASGCPAAMAAELKGL